MVVNYYMQMQLSMKPMSYCEWNPEIIGAINCETDDYGMFYNLDALSGDFVCFSTCINIIYQITNLTNANVSMINYMGFLDACPFLDPPKVFFINYVLYSVL